MAFFFIMSRRAAILKIFPYYQNNEWYVISHAAFFITNHSANVVNLISFSIFVSVNKRLVVWIWWLFMYCSRMLLPIAGVGNDLQILPKCLNCSYLIGYCYSIYHITGEHPGQFSYLWCQQAKTLLKYRGAQI